MNKSLRVFFFFYHLFDGLSFARVLIAIRYAKKGNKYVNNYTSKVFFFNTIDSH